MSEENFPISEEIKRQQQAQKRKRTRHNSLSPTCQDRFERRFSEIDKNNDGLIDQREIQRELETRQQNIPYKEIRYATQPSNQPISNGFKDGIFIRKKSEAMARQAQEIIAESDSDGDGKITEADFIDLMHENQKRVLEYFELLDTDADGKITIHDIISHPDLADLKLSKDEALDIIRHKLPDFYTSHLQDDDFKITKNEFIERHIDELIVLESFDRRSKRDKFVFDFREMNSYIDYEAAPVDKIFRLDTFCMGAVAGAVSRTATAPVDRLKIFFQVHHQSPEAGYVNTLRHMIREGGIRSLWRGNAVNVAKIMPEQAAKYGIFESLKGAFHTDHSRPISSLERFTAGACAGASSQTLIYPLEVVKTRMVLRATGQYSGVGDCIKQLWLDNPRCFFQGYLPTVVGILPYSGLDLLFAETIKIYLEKTRVGVTDDGTLRWWVPFIIGGTSSATAGTICYPFNLIKTKMQAMRPKDYGELGSPKENKPPRVTQIVSEVYRTHGFRGLYSGIQANLLKGVLASSISWGVWDNLKNTFNYKSK